MTTIEDTWLDGRTKGVPPTAGRFRLREIAAKGWNVLAEDMPLPLMVLKRSSLEHNGEVFAAYVAGNGLSLAPHGKTTMAPQIFAGQLARGAWAMTAATVNQMEVMRRFGVKRIVLANQLVGRAAVEAVAAALAADVDFEFYCFLDSLAQLDNMARHLREAPPARPIRLLVEIGVAGGRTGVRRPEEALALIEAIAAADPARFRFAGIAAFEGVVPGGTAAGVGAFIDTIVETVRAIPREAFARLDEFVLSAGGSSWFDLVAERFQAVELPVPVRVLLRSGCYVTHDSGLYQAAQAAAEADPTRRWSTDLRPALEAWAYVQSVPEPGLALLTMGKRDIPYDAGLPIPLRRYRPGAGWLEVGAAEIFSTNDQHAYARLGPGADWQVGDMIGSGISHPCTAFDKWRFIPVVDDAYGVVDGVLTFF